MEFNKPYNRSEFINFLQNSFLPDDFVPSIEEVSLRTKVKYTSQITKLGMCPSLDLVVYELQHKSHHEARVSLSKEAFRFLADEMAERALVIFVPENDFSTYRFSLIEITLDISENSAHVTRAYSNPRRLSHVLGQGIAYYTPNKYLNSLGQVVNADDLRGRFSVEKLTKEFYNELSDWYAWAIKEIKFPNNLEDDTDNEKFNHESAIRMITRLIFIWFLKQRGLVPNEFFDEKYLSDNLLKNFYPNKKMDMFYKSTESIYYKAILQNLFFAMLNSPMTKEGSKDLTERRFRKDRNDYDNNKLMRYEKYFKDPQLFVKLANRQVPFLNGGLFDCLDDKDNGLYYDGFSDREKVSQSLVVPDYLFFGEPNKTIDLSDWYGDKNKKCVSAHGLLDILKTYNFTVEENTPFDQDVALDPELLGKVFENLLASYNPETQVTARKQTGSFYTPREIVQYMVDESLIAHLKRTVGNELENEYHKLLSYSDEKLNLDKEQKKAILNSLYKCKILDPACGSGAFPMGALQQMVHILNELDPDNTMWKDMMLEQAINETSDAYKNATADERAAQISDIERSFDENINKPDYARKLYLIENCIYGVDIQPIAIQISKLRFFISLVIDQNILPNKPEENFGIRPLPNLEAKFVAANTLVGLTKHKETLFENPGIKAKMQQMKEAKHKIFGAKTVRTKRKYKEILINLRQEISKLLQDNNIIGNEDAMQLSSWDMFDQNSSSPFFDSEWMFNIKNGFDIVIANPPYIESRNSLFDDELKNKLFVQLFTNYGKGCTSFFSRGADLLVFFYELALRLISNDGICTFITQNSWLNSDYGKKFQNFLLTHTNILAIIDSNFKHFSTANVNTIITIFQGKKAGDEIIYKKLYMESKQINNETQSYTRHMNVRDYKKFSTTDPMIMKYKWGLLFQTDETFWGLLQKANLKGEVLERKKNDFDIGQGLNLPKANISEVEKKDFVPLYSVEDGATLNWQISHTYIDSKLINKTREIPALIMPRGVGRYYYCAYNALKGYSASYVEIYSNKNLEEILRVWLFCNSSLCWLMRECSGRKNLGGGLLKAEATDMKAFPLYYPFPCLNKIKELFRQSQNVQFKGPIEEILNSPHHKEIDKIVNDFLGLSSHEEEYIKTKLINEINNRNKKSRREYVSY